jgi:hypothetical protein
MTGKTDGGLRALFRKNVPGHWTAIESGWSAAGVPDAEYCLPPLGPGGVGAQGWIELKAARGGAVVVRPLQAAWAAARIDAGGRCLLAVRQELRGEDILIVTSGQSLSTMLWAKRRRRPDAISRYAGVEGERRAGVTCRIEDALTHTHVAWRGGPARWDWQACAAALRNLPC